MPARKRSTRKANHAAPTRRDTGDTPRFTEAEVARHWDSNADAWADQVARGWDLYRECLNNPAILKLIGKQTGKVGTREIARIRVGVGRPEDPCPGEDEADFLLSDFSPSERKIVDEAIETAVKAVVVILTDGLTAAMNKFN